MADTLQTILSQENILKILEKKLNTNEFSIMRYNIRALGEWVGNCGDHAILTATITLQTTEKPTEESYTFFVKLYPRIDCIIEFIEGTGSFRKEITVYKIFDKMREESINILKECVSNCYLTETNKFLVMENLTDQGYVGLNKHECFDYDTVKVILEALAKLHASSLIYEERLTDRLKKPYRLNEEYENELEDSYFNSKENFPVKKGTEAAILGILNLIELYDFPKKLLSGKDFHPVLEEVCHKVFELAKPSKKFRNVICHGDLWATNILVKFDDNKKPIDCNLVDFQCARYAPPAQDVLAVIHLTTSKQFRWQYMYNLLGIYYTNLEKHITVAGYDMKKIISFDDFLASCEELKVFALIQTAMYFPLVLLKSDVVKAYFTDYETNKKAFDEDRSLLVKDNMDQDENYKNRIYECMLDLKEYCDYN